MKTVLRATCDSCGRFEYTTKTLDFEIPVAGYIPNGWNGGHDILICDDCYESKKVQRIRHLERIASRINPGEKEYQNEIF